MTTFSSSDNFIKLGLETKLFAYGPVRGTIYFLPYGYSLWTKTKNYLDHQFQKLGVENVYFSSLIPYSLFAQEKNHIQGFNPEVLLIRSAGDKRLKEELVLRPTSEVSFCYYFAQAVHSYRDLPLLFNQWVNVFRWEKNPNPFLRNIEFLWNEGHTLHLTSEDALNFCQKIFALYQEMLTNYFQIPVFAGQKSEIEKFAGAKITWALETILPDGQFLQLATVHYFDQNFTKAFAIKCLDATNKFFYPYQTSWGISTRSLAALIQTHRDQKGLVLPFALAKKQVMILPIYGKKEKENLAIDDYCQILQTTLQSLDFQCQKLVDKKRNIGFYQHQSEKEGIPLKIEIGIQELRAKTVTYKLRTAQTKITLPTALFYQKIHQIQANFDQKLYQKASQNQTSLKILITDFTNYKSLTKNKIFEVYFCNQAKCELKIKTLTKTVSRILWKVTITDRCFHCQTATSWKAFFGRAY